MQTIVGWHVELEFSEDEDTGRTRASCMVRLPDGTELRGHGRAKRHPDDMAQQRVGEEIAAARALNELCRNLMKKAGGEIEEVTHIPAHLAM